MVPFTSIFLPLRLFFCENAETELIVFNPCLSLAIGTVNAVNESASAATE